MTGHVLLLLTAVGKQLDALILVLEQSRLPEHVTLAKRSEGFDVSVSNYHFQVATAKDCLHLA